MLVQPTSVPPISELGPDALLEPMTVDELFECFSKKKIAIKTLLLDQVVTAFIIFIEHVKLRSYFPGVQIKESTIV